MASELFFVHDTLQVDTVDVQLQSVILGLSRLEGNIWGGELHYFPCLSELHVNERTVLTFNCGISTARFSRGGELIAVACDDGNLAIFSGNNSLEGCGSISCHDDIISSIAFPSCNNSYIGTVGWDGNIKVLDLQSKAPGISPIYSNEYLDCILNDINFSEINSSVFATVGQDGFIRTWDMRVADVCNLISNLGQTSGCVLWDPLDEFGVLVGLDDGSIRYYDTRFFATPLIEQRIHHSRIRRLRLFDRGSGDFTIVSVSEDTSCAVLGRTLKGSPLDCIASPTVM